jgi:hypothetical protein
VAFAEALRRNRTLEWLNLYGNIALFFSDCAFSCIPRVLLFRCFRAVAGCNISDTGAAALHAAVPSTRALKLLRIGQPAWDERYHRDLSTTARRAQAHWRRAVWHALRRGVPRLLCEQARALWCPDGALPLDVVEYCLLPLLPGYRPRT